MALGANLLLIGAVVAFVPDVGTSSVKMAEIAPAAGGETVRGWVKGSGDDYFAPHRALYHFKMVSVESGAGITGLKGEMYFEQDDVCDAFTTDQRFTTEYQYPEKTPVLSKSHYVAWEAKDGALFHFSSDKSEGGRPTEILRGAIERVEGEKPKAVFSRPENLVYDLPQDYALPIAHTIEMIRHAKEGKKIYNAVIFDGTDADGPVEVNTFIGPKVTPAEISDIVKADPKKIDAALVTPDAWRVRMAFFPLKDKEASAPAYEMDVILHDNGVVSHALVDYKSFRVEQKLSAIEPIAPKSCPPGEATP